MSRLKDLLDAERAKAERKHCGPDDADRARIAALEAELNAPAERSRKHGAAISAGKRQSKNLPRLQRLVLEATLALRGDATTDTEILAYLRASRRVPVSTRKYDITRARKALDGKPPQI